MTAVLLLTCPDQQGVVAATADFIARNGGNIVHAEQHVDAPADGDATFYQRVEFVPGPLGGGADVAEGSQAARDAILQAFAPVAEHFDMNVQLAFTEPPLPTALMASKQPHCLYDLLTRWRSGELPIDLRVVVSNHPDHAGICEHLGVPYVHHPVTKETKPEQERAVLATLAEAGVELVVMARYMQILSANFIDEYPTRIINIHHSFLPAFIGANPYRQAYDRGVKLIGATAHYATVDLDEGPIIGQDTVHVSHRDDVKRLTARGRDLETTVLARAVLAHAEHRVLVAGHKTIVFN